MDKKLITLERLMHCMTTLAAACLLYAIFNGTKGVILAAIILLLALVAIFVEIKAGLKAMKKIAIFLIVFLTISTTMSAQIDINQFNKVGPDGESALN